MKPTKIKRLRKCLRHIRDINTMPSTILCNGETAAETAHIYVINSNLKRNQHKKKNTNLSKIHQLKKTHKTDF
jgi:hypothetical protein